MTEKMQAAEKTYVQTVLLYPDGHVAKVRQSSVIFLFLSQAQNLGPCILK